MRRALFVVGVAGLSAVGCGHNNGGSDMGADAGITADQACNDFAKASCALLDQCRKHGTANAYGTLGACVQRTHDNCVRGLMAVGNPDDPAGVESCAIALPTETCDQYLQNTPVAACAGGHGSLATGAGCAFDGQCQTGFCGIPKGSLCGKCANAPAAGDSCAMVTACGHGMVCTPMQVCEPWVLATGACDNMTKVCAPGLTCVIPMGMMQGTCTAEASTVGATCDNRRQTAAACDPNQAVFCASSKMCVAINYVGAGAPCGAQMMASGDNVCTGASACFSPGGGMPAMCVADAVEGGACDLMIGPACMSPARCVVTGGGASGTCALPDGTMCM
jgi:hypothetical protein